MKKLAFAVIAISILLLSVVLFATLSGTARRPTLRQGLEQLIAVVDATAAAVAPGLEVAPGPIANADPSLADRLTNNHSLTDTSSSEYPGYDDCDSWKRILVDGWSASYSVTIDLRIERDAQLLMDRARRLWSQRGYQLTSRSYERNPGEMVESLYFIDSMGSTVSFNVNPKGLVAEVSGQTKCLPPG